MALQSLQQLVTPNLTANNSRTITVETPELVIAAKAVARPDPQALEGSIDVSVKDSPAKAVVPMAALDEIYNQISLVGKNADEPLAIMVAALKGDTTETLSSGTGPNGRKVTLAAPPVSMKVAFASSGETVHVSGLAKPILVTVMSERPEGYKCAFWDEQAGSWSTEGVSTGTDPDGSMQCATTHLSLFGAIFEELGQVLQCSNAKILSSEGIKKLGKGHWWRSLPGILLWVLCLVLSIGNLLAARADWKWSQGSVWNDEKFFIATPDTSLHNTGKCFLIDAIEEMINKVFDLCNLASMFAKDPKNMASDRIIATATKYSLAAHSNMAVGDVADHLWRKGEWMHEDQLAGSVKMLKVQDMSHDQYENFFMNAYFVQKIWIIFSTIQPWFSLTQYSFTTPAKVRSQLLSTEILGALFLAALFYQSSGMAISEDSEDACKPAANMWRAFIRSCIIGFICSLFAGWPIVLFASLRSREFRYALKWDEAKKKRALRKWKIKEILFWVLTVNYNTFCVFFVALFLANVSPGDHVDWLISCIFSMFDSLVVTPLKYATAIAGLATLVQWLRPQSITKNKAALGLDSETKDTFFGKHRDKTKSRYVNDGAFLSDDGAGDGAASMSCRTAGDEEDSAWALSWMPQGADESSPNEPEPAPTSLQDKEDSPEQLAADAADCRIDIGSLSDMEGQAPRDQGPQEISMAERKEVFAVPISGGSNHEDPEFSGGLQAEQAIAVPVQLSLPEFPRDGPPLSSLLPSSSLVPASASAQPFASEVVASYSDAPLEDIGSLLPASSLVRSQHLQLSPLDQSTTALRDPQRPNASFPNLRI